MALAFFVPLRGAYAKNKESVLYSFAGGNDGASPYGGLLADSSGNLYGTTSGGGTAGYGTVFKIAPNGTETVLYSFCSQTSCTDGSQPYAGVIADSAGNLYGTTVRGGAADQGTVFRLAPDGTETVLHSFCSQQYCADGEWPYAGVIRDSAGNLYGTTFVGGGGDDGAVFKIAKNGHETVLHRFGNAGDGYWPYAGLIADAQGNLYGTTDSGGAADYGTVFELAPDGTETVLYSFCTQSHCTDGAGPEAGLIMDSSGNLYGTTGEGGEDFNGTIFKLVPSGIETVLYSFCTSNPCHDSKLPHAGLIMDKTGNLYGTTTGASYHGTVFKLAPDGTATVLHAFKGSLSGDGADPYAGLIMDAQGNLYGTTVKGGKNNYGTVFKVAQ